MTKAKSSCLKQEGVAPGRNGTWGDLLLVCAVCVWHGPPAKPNLKTYLRAWAWSMYCPLCPHPCQRDCASSCLRGSNCGYLHPPVWFHWWRRIHICAAAGQRQGCPAFNTTIYLSSKLTLFPSNCRLIPSPSLHHTEDFGSGLCAIAGRSHKLKGERVVEGRVSPLSVIPCRQVSGRKIEFVDYELLSFQGSENIAEDGAERR